PEDAPERRGGFPIVLGLGKKLGLTPPRKPEEEDVYMATHEMGQKWGGEPPEKGVEKRGATHAPAMLTPLLRSRFGGLEPEFESLIRTASVEELDRWIERVIAAKRIEDVFAT